MKKYVDRDRLQEFATKLTAKYKNIFALQAQVGSPLVASTVAGMTDHDKIYVYVGSESGYTSGNWYYWDGSAWTSGGVYNSQALETDDTLSVSGMAADAQAVGDAISRASGLTKSIKETLLACFQNVAWANANGQTYYSNLFAALYGGGVARISAVFTQGQNTIYSHDSLDVLRQYLVVTAHLDSNTNIVVEDYELSGTLTAGTSTITVTYEEKTTTFSVTVTQGVPSAYKVYDWVKYALTATTSRAMAQWLQLKQYDDLNALSMEMKVAPLGYSGTLPAFFGRRSASGNASSFAFYNSTTGALGYHLHGTEISGSIYTAGAQQMDLGVPNIIKVTNASASPSTIQVNGNDIITVPWTNSNVLNLAPVLFTNPIADGNSNFNWQVQIGQIKFFDLNDVLISHYYPAVRIEDNRIGMYDLVEDVFYTSTTSSYSTIGNSNCLYAVGDWS